MSFTAEEAPKKANFYKIKKNGEKTTFVLKSTKDDPQAVPRSYTNPKTKENGTAYERVYPALNGKIENIYFAEKLLEDGTRLKSLNIKLGESEDGTEQIATMPEDSRFASDFLAKLPNIDLEKPIRIFPYDFEPDKGARKVGLSITQEGDDGLVKIKSFFVEEEMDGSDVKYTNLHGYPEPTDEDRGDWPFYYKKVNKFLIKYATDNILPKFQQDDTRFTASTPTKKGDITQDDIPF